MTRSLIVVRAGALTTVQDLGRVGWAHLGVPRSGAADRESLRLANRLVGNDAGAAGLEVTVGGLEVQATAHLTVAVTGAACPITVDGVPVPARAVLQPGPGARLRLGAAVSGVRAYLAVRGGIAVAEVLGSRSTDTLSGLGPAVIADGDVLPIGTRAPGWPLIDVAAGSAGTNDTVRLTAIAGPRADALADGGTQSPGSLTGLTGLTALTGTTWTVSGDSDRVGVRLEGPPLPIRHDGPVRPSEGAVLGAIQVPPSGRPVLFLADHPVTGGYPVVAVVTDGSIDRAAQLRPGQRVEFRLLDPPEIKF
jgi:biotin-dependent carboxylase-like uncharacterized protein